MTDPLPYPWAEALTLVAATEDLAASVRQLAQTAESATDVIASWRGRGRITFDRDLEDHVASLLRMAGTLESQVELLGSQMTAAQQVGAGG